MHTALKHYTETKDESKDFIVMMRERIADRTSMTVSTWTRHTSHILSIPQKPWK
jgi:hypothetical protein